MIRGWFIGDFEPSVKKTGYFEVAVQEYNEGDKESKHYHKEAEEITALVRGRASFNEIEYDEGDIIVIPPGQVNEFVALTDVIAVVVKTPSVKGDKYLV